MEQGEPKGTDFSLLKTIPTCKLEQTTTVRSSEARQESQASGDLFCIDCGKKIRRHGKAKRCLKCYKKSRKIPSNNPFYGKTHPNVKLFGNKNGRWKGGKIKTTEGYIYIYKPNHPFSRKDRYVREHRLVMEKYLGRYLKPEEVVHHINNIKSDNRLENLILFNTKSEHRKFHNRNKIGFLI